MNWKILASAVVILTIGAVAVLNKTSISGPPSGLVQEANPEAILNHVKSLKAPVTLVNFWASWCEPCKVEFPHILALKKSYADKGLAVVFISVDEPTDLATAENFLKQNHVNFVSFYKGTQSLKFVSQIFPNWTGAVPATVLFGPEGQIVDSWEGDASFEEFEAKIKPHLKDL